MWPSLLHPEHIPSSFLFSFTELEKRTSFHLHNLVGLATEVFGAETSQEVHGGRCQEWAEPLLKQRGHKRGILQLGTADILDDELSNGIEGLWCRWTADVGSLER